MSPRTSITALAAVLAIVGCGDSDPSTTGTAANTATSPISSGPSRSAADRAFAACLQRAGALLVRSRADVRFLSGTSTEGDGTTAITNGLVSAGRGIVQLEWMSLDGSQQWRVFSRSHETETDSPDYEDIWQRVVGDAPDLAVLEIKRTGSPASFTAARRCVGRD